MTAPGWMIAGTGSGPFRDAAATETRQCVAIRVTARIFPSETTPGRATPKWAGAQRTTSTMLLLGPHPTLRHREIVYNPASTGQGWRAHADRSTGEGSNPAPD